MRLGNYIPDEKCPEEFEDLPVVFYAHWMSYEEDGWVVVFDFLGEYMVCEGGHCVMAENNDFLFDPVPYSELEWYIEEVRTGWDPENIEIDLLKQT